MKNAPSEVSPNLAFILYYSFKLLPVVVGGFSVFLGFKLFIPGVTGQASIDTKTISGQMLNAAPGLFFAVGGITSIIFAVCKGVDIRFSPRRKGESGRALAFNSDPFEGRGPPAIYPDDERDRSAKRKDYEGESK